MIMLKGKLTIDEYKELGEIDIYDLVAVITLNAFNKGRQSLEV